MSETNYDPTGQSEHDQTPFMFEPKQSKRVVRRGPRRKGDEPENSSASPRFAESSQPSEFIDYSPGNSTKNNLKPDTLENTDTPLVDDSKKKKKGRPKKIQDSSKSSVQQDSEVLFSSDRDDSVLDTTVEDSNHTIIPRDYDNDDTFSNEAKKGSELNSSRGYRGSEGTFEGSATEEEYGSSREGQSTQVADSERQSQGPQQGQGHPRQGSNRNYQSHGNHPGGKFKRHFKFNKQDKKPYQNQHQHPNQKKFNKGTNKNEKQVKRWGQLPNQGKTDNGPILGDLQAWEVWYDSVGLEELIKKVTESNKEALQFSMIYEMPLLELAEFTKQKDIVVEGAPNRIRLISEIIKQAYLENTPCVVKGVIEILHNGHGLILYQNDSYNHRPLSTFVHKTFVKKLGLKYGHIIEAIVYPPREDETCPSALKILSVMDQPPEQTANTIPFTDLIPYYPTERIILETKPGVAWDNLSMRVVDLLTPVGLGQRGLIVAPPRTGKTVLLQSIANAILVNKPKVHLIVLLLDERPEEVTDFKRQVNAEIISSTFDETAESHVHAAEVVIQKAKRMVEVGQHVVILLDSITRLARAYNTMLPSSGKVLSGGVEATALQWPKRFFGAARNIEGGGSLTILGSALIETGSRMDEVIFEEFKGTGNMELNLDRALSDKRIFPAINLERSGTRKEELLYHPDEMAKVYSLRRAMKGVPSTEAMEMLIQRMRKTKSNAEFLMGLNS